MPARRHCPRVGSVYFDAFLRCVLTGSRHSAHQCVRGSKHYNRPALACCQVQLTTCSALHADIGMEQWQGRPESFPLRILVPHSYVHAQVCASLVLYNCFLFSKDVMRPREGRGHRLLTTVTLLWAGFGVAGTIFFATLFACLEAYAHAKWPSPMASQCQKARQRPVKREARRVEENAEDCSRKVPQGILVRPEYVLAPLVMAFLLAVPALVAGKGTMATLDKGSYVILCAAS